MRFHIHRYQTIRDTGVHEYQVCRCGKRRVTNTDYADGGGYQPWDRHWLNTGEWRPLGPPPRHGRPFPTGEDVMDKRY